MVGEGHIVSVNSIAVGIIIAIAEAESEAEAITEAAVLAGANTNANANVNANANANVRTIEIDLKQEKDQHTAWILEHTHQRCKFRWAPAMGDVQTTTSRAGNTSSLGRLLRLLRLLLWLLLLLHFGLASEQSGIQYGRQIQMRVASY